MEKLSLEDGSSPLTLETGAGYAMCILVNMEGSLFSSREQSTISNASISLEAAEAYEILSRFSTLNTGKGSEDKHDHLFHFFVHMLTYIKHVKQLRIDSMGHGEDNSAEEFVKYFWMCVSGKQEGCYPTILLGREEEFLQDGGALKRQFAALTEMCLRCSAVQSS